MGTQTSKVLGLMGVTQTEDKAGDYVREMINCLPLLEANKVVRRPPLQPTNDAHLDIVDANIGNTKSIITNFNGEDYLILADNGGSTGATPSVIKVYKVSTGVLQTISYGYFDKDGFHSDSSLASTIHSYCKGSAVQLRNLLSGVFMFNNEKKLTFDSASDPIPNTIQLLISVKEVVVGTVYIIRDVATGTTAQTTGASGDTLSSIRGRLITAANTNLVPLGGYGTFIAYGDNGIYASKDSSKAVATTVSVGLASDILPLVIDKANAVADLPIEGKPDYTVKIQPEGKKLGGYYVRMDSEGKHWEECGIGYNNMWINTSPVQLKMSSGGTLRCGFFKFTARASGDDDTNPFPQFLNDSIVEAFMYKGRLCLLSTHSLHMSSTEDPYNFFRQTVLEVLPSDAINGIVEGMDTTGEKLQRAIPYSNGIVLLGTEQMYLVTSAGAVTPTSISVAPLMSVGHDGKITGRLGADMYFGSKQALYNIYTQQDTRVHDVAEVSSHCPTYLSSSLEKSVSLQKHGLMVMADGTNTVYVLSQAYQSDKMQKAIHKWTFSFDVVGLLTDNNDKIYLLYKNGFGYGKICHMDFSQVEEQSFGYKVYLDFGQLSSGGVYGGTGTSINQPSNFGDYTSSKYFVIDASTGVNLGADMSLPLIVEGDYSSVGSTFIGITYESLISLSKPKLYDRLNQAVNYRTGTIRTMDIEVEDTTHYELNVSVTGKPTSTFNFYSSLYGASWTPAPLPVEYNIMKKLVGCEMTRGIRQISTPLPYEFNLLGITEVVQVYTKGVRI